MFDHTIRCWSQQFRERKSKYFHHVIAILPMRGNETETRTIVPSCYEIDQMVGKAVIQVGIKHNELTGDDSETLGKISQAINCAEELTVESLVSASPLFIRVIVPVLVVPAGGLSSPRRRRSLVFAGGLQLGHFFEDLACAVGRAVIHEDDFLAEFGFNDAA
jgi:hypothetical protein